MYIEGYLFYASLTSIIILLSYKTRVIRRYDKVNQNHVHFDSFPRVRVWLLETVHAVAKSTKRNILKPFWRGLIKNMILIKRGAVRFVEDVRYGRRRLGDMIEKSDVASGYMQTIIDQKKEIRKKARKRLKF
ncbi:MAG: hypothetical protein KAS07_01460 [Candidatus Pacebacteria bacterium]|nr:hypothetical protein [Candidatus Paceibacterota bacterium]